MSNNRSVLLGLLFIYVRVNPLILQFRISLSVRPCLIRALNDIRSLIKGIFWHRTTSTPLLKRIMINLSWFFFIIITCNSFVRSVEPFIIGLLGERSIKFVSKDCWVNNRNVWKIVFSLMLCWRVSLERFYYAALLYE